MSDPLEEELVAACAAWLNAEIDGEDYSHNPRQAPRPFTADHAETQHLAAFVRAQVEKERERCAAFLDRYAAIDPLNDLSPVLKRYAECIRSPGGGGK